MMIETDRLIIRDFTLEDIDKVHLYAKDEKVVRFMEWGPNTYEETEAFVNYAIEEAAKEKRSKYDLAIICKDSNELIGGVALSESDEKNRVAVVGYTLNPKFWGKGYATEASRRMIEYGFEVHKFHRIEATCDVRNRGSARVLEKSGLKLEGVIREHILLRDGWRNSNLYSILNHEYTKQ